MITDHLAFSAVCDGEINRTSNAIIFADTRLTRTLRAALLTVVERGCCLPEVEMHACAKHLPRAISADNARRSQRPTNTSPNNLRY